MDVLPNYRITDIIEKKRNGEKLDDAEIVYFVESFAKSTMVNILQMQGSAIDRCQIGAMLMAIYMKGLDEDETSKLTEAMTNSGFVFTWPKEWGHLVVDKHSTGGVGDKVSIVLAPALAAVGLKVPMISNTSIRHTCGTVDRMRSIPGFRSHMHKKEIKEVINSIGCCIIGQSDDYAPADTLLYQCREMTATVDCPPLIVSSIVSKKLCEGVKALVYDVKFGKGSIFHSKDEAEETARNLVQFSKSVKSTALLTSMENPLGKTIGMSFEIAEAIDCLKGKGPLDLIQLTCALGSELLQLVHGKSRDEGIEMIMNVLNDGSALEKFCKMIVHQGVSPEEANELCYGDASKVLPLVEGYTDIFYEGDDGYIQGIDALILAEVWREMVQRSCSKVSGIGLLMWERTPSNMNPGVGLKILKSVGDYIKHGEDWVRIYHYKDHLTHHMQARLQSAVSVQETQKERILIEKRLYMTGNGKLIEEDYY